MQARDRQTTQAVWDDLEQVRFFGDLSPADSLAEQEMGRTLVTKAASRMKNLPTNMTCTRLIGRYCPQAFPDSSYLAAEDRAIPAQG